MATFFNHPTVITCSTFTKGGDSLTVECCGSMEIALTYLGASPQVLHFTDPTTVAFFQADLERELLQAGWKLNLSELEMPYGPDVGRRWRAQLN